MRGHFPDLDAKVPKPLDKRYDLNPLNFGAKIDNKRSELNMSTNDFGKLLGVSETTVFLWEANKVVARINKYPKLLEFLDMLP